MYVPNMFPIDVCEFQIPKIKPRFDFPDHLETMVTTPGQPVYFYNKF